VSDRRIHASAGDRDGSLWEEVVRYDRVGKWYMEVEGLRQSVRIHQAARRAVELEDQGGEIFLGVPGGSRFDQLVQGLRSLKRR
jgi:hypothetical protein